MFNTLATVTLKHRSGFPADDAVNTFAFGSATDKTAGDALLELAPALVDFYNQANGTGDYVARYISSEIDRAIDATIIRFYDLDGALDGSPHGSPVAEDTFTLGAAIAGNPYPSEVAVALTLRASTWDAQLVEAPDGSDPDAKPDRPRQRHTGKLYLGPLQLATGGMGASVTVRPTAGYRTCLLDAAEALDTDVTTNGWRWSVWSRKDASLRLVTAVQVDDAFDSQRRRGTDATVRDTRTF